MRNYGIPRPQRTDLLKDLYKGIRVRSPQKVGSLGSRYPLVWVMQELYHEPSQESYLKASESVGVEVPKTIETN